MLHFIDQFLLDEDLKGFQLTTSDYNEISLGILIGSLEKINNISPDFIESLKENELDYSLKAIFLIKVLRNLNKSLSQLDEKDKVNQFTKINEMNCSSQVLLEIIEYVECFKEELIMIYRELFTFFLKKCSVNDKIITLAIFAYPLKNMINLQSTFFLLDLKELEDITKSPLSDDYYKLTNLFFKGCQIVFEQKLPPKDVLSIIIFNKFLEFLNYSLENCPNIDYVTVISKLIRYNSNFSRRQLYRFRDFYNKMIDNKKGFKNLEFEKFFDQDPEPKHQPFMVKKLNANSYPNKFREDRHQGNQSIREAHNERPYKESKEEPEKELDSRKNQDVGNNIKFLFDNFQTCSSDEIDISYLTEVLRQMINVSAKAVNYHLYRALTYQRGNSGNMQKIWEKILEALGSIDEYPKQYYFFIGLKVSSLER